MYKKLKKTYKCAEEKVNTKHNIFLRTKWQKKVFKKN